MKEARLIVPVHYNDGTEANGPNVMVQDWLVGVFGGFTLTEGKGGWRDPKGNTVTEPVNVYDVAMADNAEAISHLFEIARKVKNVMEQQAVYVRLPNGLVQFV